MIVIVIFFAIFNSCVQDALLQELKPNPSETVVQEEIKIENKNSSDVLTSNTKKGSLILSETNSFVSETDGNQVSDTMLHQRTAFPLKTLGGALNGVGGLLNIPIEGTKKMIGSFQDVSGRLLGLLRGGVDTLGNFFVLNPSY